MKITDQELDQIVDQIQTLLTRESSDNGERQILAEQLIMQTIIWGCQNGYEGIGILQECKRSWRKSLKEVF
jgi:hypothetical protein